MASCSDEKGPWGIEQTNPQLPGFEADKLEVVPAAALDGTVDLKFWNDENLPVPVAEVASAENWPAAYDMEFVMELSPVADFARVAEVATVTETIAETTTVFVDPDDWQAA